MFRRENKSVAELVNEVQDLLDSNDLDKALEKINLAISMYPRNPDLHDLKSDILFHSMDYPGTLKELKFIEAMEPHNASNYSRESLCYMSMGKQKEALEAAEKAIKVDPEYIPSYYNRARALNNMGRIDDAMSAYKLASEKDPSDPDTHRDLGELYLLSGDFNKALNELKLAMRFRNDDETTINLMADLRLVTGDVKKFAEVLINAYQKTDDPSYLIRMTDMFIYFGEISKAEKLAEEFYRMDDKSIEFAYNLAKIYWYGEKHSEANKVFENLVRQDDSKETHLSYIEFLNETNQYELILSIIDDIINKYPWEEMFMFYKFDALSGNDDHVNALEIIKNLYEKKPDDPLFGSEYAVELSFNGVNDVSINMLDKIRNSYNSIRLEKAYYRIYINWKSYDKAMEWLNKAISREENLYNVADKINEAIDDSIIMGYQSSLMGLIDSLLETTDQDKHDIYTAQKACILFAEKDPDGAEKLLKSIKPPGRVCSIIEKYLDFENHDISLFLDTYLAKNCEDD